MKKSLLLLIVPFLSFGQIDSLNVLFIGNSYTASNNLPYIVSTIANSMGDYLYTESNLIGGATLQTHVNNTNTNNLIISGNWDYVSIQEQSQYPSFPLWQVEQDVFPYATQLNQLISDYNDCGQTIFFMTWGRENGDINNCPKWPQVCTYEGMDDLLHERYMIMANDNGAFVSPVGAVWRYIINGQYDLDLYSADGSHPSFLGSYVAGVCFYTALFQKNPLNIPWNEQWDMILSEADSEIIHEVVKIVVYDNLDEWNITSDDLDNDNICNNTDNCPQNYNPNQEDFDYTIRLVSEITESNGSSSMASVCGGTMAMMDAGVPVKDHVAGIAMGLIKEDNRVAVLTDILGDEDHLGDMDFKVAGTDNGITALQMDIKITGITTEIMQVALSQAREGIDHILKIMKKSLKGSREKLSKFAPQILTLKIHTDKIRDVIGKGGAVIKGLAADTGATIDIDDNGLIKIACTSAESGEEALNRIKEITADVEVDQIYDGKVIKILDFGAIVSLLPGKDGLLHISQISHERIKAVKDHLSEGDEVKVKVIEVDDKGRVRVSAKALTEPPAKEE